MPRRSLSALVVACSVVAGVSAAHAGPLSALSAQWLTLSRSNPDVEHGIDGGTVTGLVQDTLGPDGLPVVSAKGASYSGPSGPITDVNGKGELLWWTPGGTVSVNNNYPSTVTLPVSFSSNLFPAGSGVGGDGSDAGYLTAHLFGTFVAPISGEITLSLGSDDDAWVFINGQLVDDNGGVHALTVVPDVVSGLAAGTNRIDVFFADRHTVQSALDFGADVNFSPMHTPEPASFAVLGAGLLGLGFVRARARWA